MVQWQMYCPEQIIVPQKFPNILKTYAKAVIRTQPYDLLRWSAAYFRCLALNLPPPVKVRLEKESRFGKLTKGYLRVLIEQLGKGFFVQRDVLQHSWATLSLPEEELLKFLSLCRMLHWSQIHWLELFAVMVGSLNDNFNSTVSMLFELLTDDPEGGPSPIPSWMFNVCYSFISRLDCSRPQSFINGRKVLGEDKLEDLNIEPDPPKIYSIDLFRYALIERFIQNEQYRLFDQTNETFDAESQRSFFSNQSNVTTAFNFVGLNDREDLANEAKDFKSVMLLLNEAQREAIFKFNDRETRDKVIQHLLIEKKIKKRTNMNKDAASVTSLDGSIRSDISSSFKFIGDLKNPYKAGEKTPDVDNVLLMLSKAQRNTLRNVTKRAAGDERVKEELFRDLSPQTDDISEIEKNAKNTDLSKGLEAPWTWVHQFATTAPNEKSYNFLECETTPAGEPPTLLTDGSFDVCTGHFRDDESDFNRLTLTPNAKTVDEVDETFQIFEGLINEVINNIGQAIDEGKCDIKNIESICSVISETNFDGKEDDIKMITETLHKADERRAHFENLNELGNYLKGECTNELKQKASLEPLSKKLLECDIEIDENVVSKEVPNDMILGLVDEKVEAETVLSTVISNEKSTKDNQPFAVSTTCDERNENILMVDGFITDAIDDINNTDDIKDADVEIEDNNFPTFNCDMPALPGIGKACSPETIDALLTFILPRARDEKGMVYPRFFKEPDCPDMIDSLN